MSDQLEERFENLLTSVWADLQRPGVVWQLATLAACVLLAWVLSRAALRRAPDATPAKWQFGVEGLKLVLFPLFALVLIAVARAVLRSHISVSLLDLAVPLAGSAALIRILVYTLRYVFAPSGLLAAFERVVATIVWGAVALHLLGVLPVVLDALDAIEFHVGRQRISLWLVLQALFWATVTVLAALWAGSAIEARLARASSLHANLRVVFSRLAKAGLIVLAVVLVLPLVGIDLTVLSVFGGALGVGIGLGLQRIASNYTSGFILLLDRSIQIGDMITADQFYGRVKDITTRYVVLQAPDGREAIIPNELLITTKVLNHSYAQKKEIRHGVEIRIAYGTEVERALRLMERAAAREPRVLRTPPPIAVVTGLAESGVTLELQFCTTEAEPAPLDVKSVICLEILRAFRDEGVDIAPPQLGVRTPAPAGEGKLPPESSAA
jgi:small-conductance mechanosensitive channel